MFIASGGAVIEQYVKAASSINFGGQNIVLNLARPPALALGFMCIITGLIFFVDVVFTALEIAKCVKNFYGE